MGNRGRMNKLAQRRRRAKSRARVLYPAQLTREGSGARRPLMSYRQERRRARVTRFAVIGVAAAGLVAAVLGVL